MTAAKNDDIADKTLHLLAEQRGLARAFMLFPDAVKAAAERGQKPIAPVPDAAVTEPAFGFDPTRVASAL